MADIPLTLVIDVAPVIRALNAIEERASDLRPVFNDDLVPLVENFFERQFDSEGRYGGTPWLPLRPVTIKLRELLRKPIKGGLYAILQNELRLRRSLTVRGAVDGVLEITPQRMEVGTTRRGAAQQQRGWTLRNVYRRKVSPRFIPPRRLVPDAMPSPFTEAMETALARYLEGG